MIIGLFSFLATCQVALAIPTDAGLNPTKVHSADLKKTKSYIRDGLFVSGDSLINDVNLKEIRFAKNNEYERIVLDFPGAGARAPYLQVDVSPEMRRLVVTVFGKIKLGFDPTLFVRSFQKSALIQSVKLYPQIEIDRWVFALQLKEGKKPQVEVFELSQPSRTIIDLKP